MRSPRRPDPLRSFLLLAAAIAGVLAVLFMLGAPGCSGVRVYTADPLIDQVLHAIPGFDGKLGNRACLRYEKGECKIWDVRTYDLRDQAVRDRLVALEFVCNVAGDRYKICPDRPGLCQYTYRRAWLLAPKKLEVRYLPVDPISFHLDAGTRCMNEDHNPFDEP